MSVATESIQRLPPKEWKWPLDLRAYDQAAPSMAELSEIRTLLKQEWRGRYRTNLWIPRLERLMRPILDAEDLFEPGGANRSSILWIMLTGMLARRSSLWSWSPRIWATICCANRPAFTERYGVAGTARMPFLAVALLLQRPVNLEGCGVFERVLLAEKVFGQKAVDSAIKEVADILKTWGYGVSHRAHNESVLAELMLLSGSPLPQHMSREVLAALFEKDAPIQRRYAMQRLSQALHHLGFIEAPLQHGWNLPRSGQSPDLAANVDKRWARYVERWFSTSTLATVTRTEIRYMLLKVGRWVTAVHPEVASPELWTRDTAAQWVAAAVCRMRVGEWHNQVRRIAEHGKPLSPGSATGKHDLLPGGNDSSAGAGVVVRRPSLGRDFAAAGGRYPLEGSHRRRRLLCASLPFGCAGEQDQHSLCEAGRPDGRRRHRGLGEKSGRVNQRCWITRLAT